MTVVKHFSNWASTYSATPRDYHEPQSVEEVASLVKQAAADGRVVKVVGGAHSPNDCAMSNDTMISLKRMNKVLVVDKENAIVKMQAGIYLHELHEILDGHGLAVPNLGSISEQSIAGCICTGTHGTGAQQGILATHMLELQMVAADGSVKILSRNSNPELFTAALCSLGCLGIITGVVLQCVPAFDLHVVESEDTLQNTLHDLKNRITSAPFYRFWWFPHTERVWEWRARPVPPHQHRQAAIGNSSGSGSIVSILTAAIHSGSVADLFNALPALKQQASESWTWLWEMGFGYHVLQAALWLCLIFPFLIPTVNRMWGRVNFSKRKERVDRSDRVFNINCLFKQYVDEWAVPVSTLPSALTALRTLLASHGFKAHFPIEVRFVAGDDIPLSPANGRPTAFVGIIAYKPYGYEVEHKEYFQAFERIMAAYGGRPHWAKDFGLRGDPDFAPLYPSTWHAFKALRARVDPRGVFVNDWVRRTLGLGDKADSDSTGNDDSGVGIGRGGGATRRHGTGGGSSVGGGGSGGGDGNNSHNNSSDSDTGHDGGGGSGVPVSRSVLATAASLIQQRQAEQRQQQQQSGSGIDSGSHEASHYGVGMLAMADGNHHVDRQHGAWAAAGRSGGNAGRGRSPTGGGGAASMPAEQDRSLDAPSAGRLPHSSSTPCFGRVASFAADLQQLQAA